jgi:hypothetical protein
VVIQPLGASGQFDIAQLSELAAVVGGIAP